jgi:hypothetical protein
MPDVQVEIAWDSGYNTPAASRTWTDVSDYVELADRIGIAFGRQDERSTADANSLSLTLDNTDGRFTAGRSASPYYPNVKIGRPIRVRVTPPGGTVVTRFVGFIDEWPVEWDGTDAYAKAKIRATSRLARLGLSARLRSVIEETILEDAPVRYWTMGDPSGSTSAAESSGSNGAPLTAAGSGTAVVFGNATGPASDGLTAAQFGGAATWSGGVPGTVQFSGQYLSAETTPAEVYVVRATVLLSTLPSASAHAYIVNGGTQPDDIPGVANIDSPAIAVDELGRVCIKGLTGPSINDGATHDVALLIDPGVEARLYVDGVSAGTGTVVASASPPRYDVGQGLSGTVSHVAVYAGGTPPTSTQIADWADAVLTGSTGERTDERLLRILGWAGVASTEITTETGVETMTYQQTSGQSVVEALRDVESTEGGVLYDRADGNVGFHNRSHRYQQTPAVTLDMASQHVGSDYSPKLDRSTLVNDATVENPTTGESARAVDEDSRDEYGIATSSSRSLADTYDPLLQKAYWQLASYAEPRNRVPSLTVDVLAHQGLTPSAQTLLGITVGDLLAVTNAPSQSDTTSPSYFVEGYTETIGPESYEITFNLSPTYPYLNVVILDDPDHGLDSGSILAL